MGLFRRTGRSEDAPDVAEPEEPDEARPARGPWDVTTAPEGRRVDLGAIQVPGRPGMELRMEVDSASKRVVGAAITLNGSTLQLQAFAAPRSEGIWDEIREELAESVQRQGGTVDDVPGPFGRELLARIPVRTENSRTGHRPARFIGQDGPRWFLRGVLTGEAAVSEKAAQALEGIFADTVVVRGSEPRAPRDLLTLRLPTDRTPPPVPPVDAPALNPFVRGPEITETR